VAKNDTDVAHYNFYAHQTIFEIFGRNVADRRLFVIPHLLCDVFALPGKHEPRKFFFSDSCKVGIRRDHLYRRIEMEFCVVDGLMQTFPRFVFHQSRSSGFRAVWGGSKFALSH